MRSALQLLAPERFARTYHTPIRSRGFKHGPIKSTKWLQRHLVTTGGASSSVFSRLLLMACFHRLRLPLLRLAPFTSLLNFLRFSYQSVCQVLAMLRFVMKPCAIRMSSIVLRGAQLALSAIALSKTAAYHSATHEANFILIATYSSMMYALWHLVCVEFLKIANRPRKLLSRIIDLVMAVLLVAAAISVKVAGYFPKCEPYRTNMIKCTDMSNIVVYTWVIVMPLICTFVLTYVVSSKDMELSMQPTEYVLETTPRAMKDMPMTPSEKV